VGDDTEIIDLKKIRFPRESVRLLRSIKDSGNTSHETFAPLVRLYVLMGLRLHKARIHTMEQLEELLQRDSEAEVEKLEKRITKNVLKALKRSPKEVVRR
jgi:hypothetical protein